MTQEEKLEEAKRLYKTANADQKYVLESLFPVLKESEDERYKSAIRKMYSFLPNKPKYIGDVSVEDMFAWLEKQGKHARFIETIQVGDQVTKNEDGVLVNLSQLKRVAKPSEQNQGEQKPIIEMKSAEESLGIDSETYNKIVDECIYGDDKSTWGKQCEQKPAFVPKYKIGDWLIVNNKDAYQVIEVNLFDYRLKHFLGGSMPFPFKHESSLRPWTIQDAKDGDVLVTKGDKRPFIFKGLLDSNHPNCPVAYCGIDSENLFLVSTGIYWWTDEEVEPAAKEQRDFLFQKMKEVGYEWDTEKKELKKIEPNTAAWTPMDEQRVENLLAIIEGHGYPGEVAWIKLLKDRYTWKPSDEQMAALNDINLTGSISYVGQGQELINLYNDLKKLKG